MGRMTGARRMMYRVDSAGYRRRRVLERSQMVGDCNWLDRQDGKIWCSLYA